MEQPAPFTYDGGRVDPGETQNVRYTVTETYLGDPVKMPVTVVVGERTGPTVVITAATHGDELNGIEVVREVAHEWDHSDLCGRLVCLPILNVPGFIAQQRYLPVYDRDLNRAFPGDRTGTGAQRMAARIFENFVAPADLGIDLHTSTRGRSNMLHVRADMSDETVERVARAFASNVVIDSEGAEGTLRREATAAGTSTVTVEMGEAHRFQRSLIDRALDGIRSVFAEFGLLQSEHVDWPGWRTVVEAADEKTWLRADAGGLVDVHVERGAFVEEGERIATIANPFKTTTTAVDAPFDGVLIGVLENPVVYPGNPLCHIVKVDERTRGAIEYGET
ncbi:succinylglutamate desuccinylase/aspartoacylase family protein [Halapricum hydrolyticum]|uniref:Succinylglutamate desuccinylase/aspartoacylase family protein n=1 Tax=Halapricum hydrolyticum TaxID=2979991 RepID=A0AAE3IGC6_9EURY|nr:succinylglutamate desuccinylase/aspartoacylase family protein [Halapricum hydrolyticum]MCU4718857.1 succinylglutamate desuccinylase/aspartoacylase family protein [Halapricum hydrolyticum]MCU4727865.1 succinylglutamate desuccinylase/aspartoacylase family protein [Halapricum hydrolyticum]